MVSLWQTCVVRICFSGEGRASWGSWGMLGVLNSLCWVTMIIRLTGGQHWWNLTGRIPRKLCSSSAAIAWKVVAHADLMFLWMVCFASLSTTQVTVENMIQLGNLRSLSEISCCHNGTVTNNTCVSSHCPFDWNCSCHALDLSSWGYLFLICVVESLKSQKVSREQQCFVWRWCFVIRIGRLRSLRRGPHPQMMLMWRTD